MLAYVENDGCGLHRLHQEQSEGWKFVVRLQCINFMQECLSDCNRWLLLDNLLANLCHYVRKDDPVEIIDSFASFFLLIPWFLQLLEVASHLALNSATHFAVWLESSCCHVEGEIILLKS